MVVKDKLALDWFKISPRLCLLVTAAKRDSLVMNFDLAISALYAIDSNPAFFFVHRVALSFLFGEDKHAWLVVIQNSHSGARVFSRQALSSREVIAFDVEVLIWLPALIINNLN